MILRVRLPITKKTTFNYIFNNIQQNEFNENLRKQMQMATSTNKNKIHKFTFMDDHHDRALTHPSNKKTPKLNKIYLYQGWRTLVSGHERVG